MKTYENVFIGFVDILGYKNLENKLKSFSAGTSQALLDKVFVQLDQFTNMLKGSSGITWRRYGDGYVFYSPDDKIEWLSEMVKKSCKLIAFSLNASIPLRIAITQDTINVDKPESGLTITGSGWGKLMTLENSMNWMGGILYLPNYDGTHYETVQNLIKSTHLVKEQNNVPEVTFTAPIKKTHQLLNGKSWFFNWYKILRQPKSDVDVSIKNWWSQIVQGGDINEFKEVKQKQNNSIEFADYCRELLQAANLLYFSDIDNKIEIMKIMGSE